MLRSKDGSECGCVCERECASDKDGTAVGAAGRPRRRNEFGRASRVECKIERECDGRVWLEMYFTSNDECTHSTAVPLIGRVVLIRKGIDNRNELTAATAATVATAATRTKTTAVTVAAATALAVVEAASESEEEGETE